MEKLSMCRICLVQNVDMFVVVNRNLCELYEKLTDFPFVTEDRRPILACFFCCAKLKQCYRLLRQCLEAEELFAQMMNEGFEPKPLINQGHLQFYGGFIKTPTENMSIVDECQTESIAVKEELPALCEELDIIIEPKEEHQSDELEPANFDNSRLDVAYILPHHPESDLEYDVPLIEFKSEVEKGLAICKKKRRARETKRATVAKKPKLDTRRTKQGDATTAEQTRKVKSDSGVIQTAQKLTSEPGTYFQELLKSDHRSFNQIQHTLTQTSDTPYKCDVCQRSFSENDTLIKHIRIHTLDNPFKCDVCQRRFSQKCDFTKHIRIHTGEKPYKCDICQRSFSQSCNLKKHIRIHTGEKPFKCEICLKSFSDPSALKVHLRVQTHLFT